MNNTIESPQDAVQNIILKVVYGSYVYGTTTADSDNDVRGVYCPSVDSHLSLHQFRTFDSITPESDTVLHPVRKYIALLTNSNPGCLEWLFVRPEHIIETTEAGDLLRSKRGLFLTKKIFNRYTGFARSELRRVTTITGRSGQRRRELFAKHGYDPKAAMNVIRLLEQGAEMLATGELSMPRPNADELKEIKLGHMPIVEIMRRVKEAEVAIQKAYEWSKLEPECNIDKANYLLVSIIRMSDSGRWL